MKMKWENHGIKTSLARARGLGSAHHGSEHWMIERITSLALIPLVFWLVYSIVSMAGADYEAFTLWLALPINAILMLLFIIVSFYHAALGCQVIMDDYIHHEGIKMISVILMKMAFAALGVACVFSVLKIAFQ